jgi:hypothetical protein
MYNSELTYLEELNRAFFGVSDPRVLFFYRVASPDFFFYSKGTIVDFFFLLEGREISLLEAIRGFGTRVRVV